MKSVWSNWKPKAEHHFRVYASWLRKYPLFIWTVIVILLLLGSAKTVWRVSSSRYARSYLIKQQPDNLKFQKLSYPRVSIGGKFRLQNTALTYDHPLGRIALELPELRGKLDLHRFRKGLAYIEKIQLSRPKIHAKLPAKAGRFHTLAPLALLATPANLPYSNLPFDSLSEIEVKNANVDITGPDGIVKLRDATLQQQYEKGVKRTLSFKELRGPAFPVVRKGSLTIGLAADTLFLAPFACTIHGGSVSGRATGWDLGKKDLRSPKMELDAKIRGCKLERVLSNTVLAGKMAGRIRGRVQSTSRGFGKFAHSAISFEGDVNAFRIQHLPVLKDLEAFFGEERFRSVTFKSLKIDAAKKAHHIEFAKLQGRGGFFDFDFAGSVRLRDGYALGNLTIAFADSTYDSMKASLAKMLFTRSEKGYSLEIPYAGTWDHPDLSQLAMQKGLKQLGKAIWENLFE